MRVRFAVVGAIVFLLGACGLNAIFGGESYGFDPTPSPLGSSTGYDFVLVGRVACKGAATGKLSPGDLIVTVNGIAFYSDIGITQKTYNRFLARLSTPTGPMIIEVRKGGVNGKPERYALTPGPADWSRDCASYNKGEGAVHRAALLCFSENLPHLHFCIPVKKWLSLSTFCVD